MTSELPHDKMKSDLRPKLWRYVWLVLLSLAAGYVVDQCLIRPQLNPLRKSTDTIEENLLARTPVGTPYDDVHKWVAAQGWSAGGTYFAPIGQGPVQEGVIHPICRSLGAYDSFGSHIVVFAEWWFGPDGRLEKVEVSKFIANAL